MLTTSFCRFLVLYSLLIFSAAASARAEGGGSSTDTVRHSPPPETYSLQILAADAISIGVLAASAAIDGSSQDDTFSNALSIAGVGGLVLGGPIVHATHGHLGRSGASLGLRIGLPFLGVLVGLGVADCSRGEFLCGVGEAALGYVTGLAAAIAIDAAVLARLSASEDPHAPQPDPRPATRPRPPGVTFSPRVVATPNLAFVGGGGNFP